MRERASRSRWRWRVSSWPELLANVIGPSGLRSGRVFSWGNPCGNPRAFAAGFSLDSGREDRYPCPCTAIDSSPLSLRALCGLRHGIAMMAADIGRSGRPTPCQAGLFFCPDFCSVIGPLNQSIRAEKTPASWIQGFPLIAGARSRQHGNVTALSRIRAVIPQA